MPAMLGPAAQTMQNNRPGTFTHAPESPAVATGAPSSVTLSEVVGDLPTEYGGLSHIFSDSMPAVVETAVSTPTDSLPGKLGGLVPRLSSAALSSGPAQPAPVGTTDPGPKATPSVLTRVRSALRI
jgi:hypothetical protein